MNFDKWEAFENAWNTARFELFIDRASFKAGFFMGLNAWSDHQEMLKLLEIHKKVSGSSCKKPSRSCHKNTPKIMTNIRKTSDKNKRKVSK